MGWSARTDADLWVRSVAVSNVRVGAKAARAPDVAKGSDPGPVRARISLTTTLATDRLVLRSLRPGDVRALRAFELENAEHLRAWSPRPRAGVKPTSVVEIARRIATGRKDWRIDRGYSFGVFLREQPRGGSFVGRVSLNSIVRGVFQNAYLGYLIGRAHEGRGLAREAVSAACDFAFGVLGLHRVQAAIMPHNARSLRLAEALGFREEGRAQGYLMIDGGWRDHVLFAMTSGEWLARRKSA